MKKTNSLRNFWYKLTPNQRFFVRKLYYFPIDTLDKLMGKRNKYVPPRGYIYTGSPSNSKNYINQGKHQLEILKEFADLKQDDIILDVGSGIGRTAIALAGFLNKDGIYEGFDVVERGVEWCNKKIKPDYPNFNFKYLSIFNDLYNNKGEKASRVRLPYKEKYFTKIFSFSVFTHMQIGEISNYLNEINRIIKPNGLCCSTFFLYEDDNEEFISNKENFSFKVKKNGYRLMSASTKSGNIAIHKQKLNEMMANSNFEIVDIIDGFWKKEKTHEKKSEYQDIVIFKPDNR